MNQDPRLNHPRPGVGFDRRMQHVPFCQPPAGSAQFPGHWGRGDYHPAGYYPPAGFLPRDRFVKGMLIGAAATYLLTNEQVQRALIKGIVQVWSLVQGGLEEIKERFGDAQAELNHAKQQQS